MKISLFAAIVLSFFLNSCTEQQREGWEKRLDKIAGQEKLSVAPKDTLDPDNLVLNEKAREFIDLETMVAKRQAIADVVETPAMMAPHPDHVISIKAPLAGRLTELYPNLGNAVKKDAVVGVIEDPQNLGQRLPIRAPIGGVVSARPVSKNEWVENGASLMTVIDYGTLQGVLQLYPEEQEKARVGQTVEFSGSGWAAQGKIHFISSAADPETGTVEARADVANPNGQIRTNVPVDAKIIVGEKIDLVVPQTALLPEEDHFIAFVQNQGRFEKRVVVTGIRHNGLVEIVSGLNEGETVVTRGAYQLKNLTFSSGASTVEED